MEDNAEVEEDNTTYWFSEKPAATVVVAAVFIFPFVLAYWGFAKVAKKVLITQNDRRFIKVVGRRKNLYEDILYKMDLDKKFGI